MAVKNKCSEKLVTFATTNIFYHFRQSLKLTSNKNERRQFESFNLVPALFYSKPFLLDPTQGFNIKNQLSQNGK